MVLPSDPVLLNPVCWVLTVHTRVHTSQCASRINIYRLKKKMASLVTQLVKNLPARQEAWVLSLGWEDPLENGIATHYRILAWRIP